MKPMRGYIILTCLAALLSHSLMAATMPPAISRESFTSSRSLDRLSVGYDYLAVRRNIEYGAPEVMELWANAHSAYIGYDIVPPLTVFITAGACDAKFDGMADYGSLQPKWSIGMCGNLWHYDIDDPSFMAGRLTIKSVAEFSRYDSDIDGRGDLEWTDLSAALTLGYEIYEDAMNLRPTETISLNFFFGPLFSVVDGKYKLAGLYTDFEEERWFGGVGGLDLYLSHNLCFSAQATVFEKVSVGGSVRYHF